MSDEIELQETNPTNKVPPNKGFLVSGPQLTSLKENRPKIYSTTNSGDASGSTSTSVRSFSGISNSTIVSCNNHENLKIKETHTHSHTSNNIAALDQANAENSSVTIASPEIITHQHEHFEIYCDGDDDENDDKELENQVNQTHYNLQPTSQSLFKVPDQQVPATTDQATNTTSTTTVIRISPLDVTDTQLPNNNIELTRLGVSFSRRNASDTELPISRTSTASDLPAFDQDIYTSADFATELEQALRNSEFNPPNSHSHSENTDDHLFYSGRNSSFLDDDSISSGSLYDPDRLDPLQAEPSWIEMDEMEMEGILDEFDRTNLSNNSSSDYENARRSYRRDEDYRAALARAHALTAQAPTAQATTQDDRDRDVNFANNSDSEENSHQHNLFRDMHSSLLERNPEATTATMATTSAATHGRSSSIRRRESSRKQTDVTVASLPHINTLTRSEKLKIIKQIELKAQQDNALKSFLKDKMCWICLSNNLYSELDNTDKIIAGSRRKDTSYQLWITPCKCRGTTGWVHQACLRRWIDEKQQGDVWAKVKCPKCEYPYNMVRPKTFKLVKYGMKYIHLVKTLSLFSTILIVVVGGGVVTTGIGSAIAIRVCGPENILSKVRSRPILSWLGLVAVTPALLTVGFTTKWEGPAIKLLAKLTEDEEDYENTVQRVDKSLADPIFNNSKPVLAMTSLITPIIGSFVGEQVFKNTHFFKDISSSIGKRILRALCGSGIFLAAKATLKIKYLYDLNKYHKKARIGNYKPKSESATQTRRVTQTRINIGI